MADSKEQIIDAAKSLFCENGFNGTTIREIADMAQTNVASINYHFGSKEELFKTVAHSCLKETQNIVGVLDENPKTSEELKLVLKSFLKLFCQIRAKDPRSFLFMNRNLDLFLKLDPKSFEENIWKVKQKLKDMITLAHKNKVLKKDIDPEVFTFNVFSSLSHLIRDEHIVCTFNKHSVLDENYRNKYINQTVDCLIDGAKETTHD